MIQNANPTLPNSRINRKLHAQQDHELVASNRLIRKSMLIFWDTLVQVSVGQRRGASVLHENATRAHPTHLALVAVILVMPFGWSRPIPPGTMDGLVGEFFEQQSGEPVTAPSANIKYAFNIWVACVTMLPIPNISFKSRRSTLLINAI